MENHKNWGKLQNKDIIISQIKDYCNKSNYNYNKPKFTHIKKGYTDNVFLCDINNEYKLIIKQYLEDWHIKELTVYKDILNNHDFNEPKLLFYGKRFIALEYLDIGTNYKFSRLGLKRLRSVILRKYKQTMEKDYLSNITEPFEIQKHYLIDKPYETIKKFKRINKNIIIENIYEIISGNLSKLETIININNSLRQSLEHGDLEIQNLLIVNNKLRIIDWVNARSGSGLFDINQYIENSSEIISEYNPKKDINYFSQIFNINNFDEILYKVRILMLMNKINYYMGKILDGIKFSYTKNKSCKVLLKNYSQELYLLLKSHL